MIAIRRCTKNDISMLARLNQMLIEDENADNKMTLIQLEQRMSEFLENGYDAVLFHNDEVIAGYALINRNVEPFYLRQFFICREYRRMGCGRKAFHALLSFLDVKEIDIDVYAWNPAAISFWKSLGFKERFYNMRLKE